MQCCSRSRNCLHNYISSNVQRSDCIGSCRDPIGTFHTRGSWTWLLQWTCTCICQIVGIKTRVLHKASSPLLNWWYVAIIWSLQNHYECMEDWRHECTNSTPASTSAKFLISPTACITHDYIPLLVYSTCHWKQQFIQYMHVPGT